MELAVSVKPGGVEMLVSQDESDWENTGGNESFLMMAFGGLFFKMYQQTSDGCLADHTQPTGCILLQGLSSAQVVWTRSETT